MNHTDFLAHRGLVFTIAYDVTGSVADAEDVTQDVGVKWLALDADVENPRAYLATAAAHHALNALRASRRRREEYVGDWLPDPLPTGATVASATPESPEDAALTAEAVSVAMLVVLQSLTEDQRAAFVLREVFAFGYREIAEVVGCSEDAARQLVHRARSHVRNRRERQRVAAAEHRQVVSRFVEAARTGQIGALLKLLAPDAVLITDSGGKVSAARRPVRGPLNIARFLLGLGAKYGARAEHTLTELNGGLSILTRFGDDTFSTVQADVADGRIRAFYVMRNPDKLTHLAHMARQ